MTTADKVKLAVRTETIYPAARQPEDCRFSHERFAWRLEKGKAVLVAYCVFRYRNEFGKPSGLVGRSEYSIEIMPAPAYQVYIAGLSSRYRWRVDRQSLPVAELLRTAQAAKIASRCFSAPTRQRVRTRI